MILRHLALTNFKNIAEANLDFSPKINCLLGDNGMGKSNLLDAIHFLSFARSFGRVPDSLLIRNGEDFAIVRGDYMRGDTDEEITASLRRGARKSFRRGGKEYPRLSSHIGLIPAVMVAPADLTLATAAPEERRRFVDMIISQSDTAYLDALIRYNHALEQRNRLLRDEHPDAALMATVEMMMAAAADVIVRRRCTFADELSAIFAPYYAQIAGASEQPCLRYLPSAEGPLEAALEASRRRDILLRHTTVGPHRDDMEFTLDGMPLKLTASQGQTKTFTIALRLAQYEFLRRFTGRNPLLLLDDIFDKLDSRRVRNIMEIVRLDSFGQIFITDTNRKHLDEIIEACGNDYRLWNVDCGTFTSITRQ